MSLSAQEQRTLICVADELTASDPKLASILGVFNRLTRGEAMPARQHVGLSRQRDAGHSCRRRGRTWKRRRQRRTVGLAWPMIAHRNRLPLRRKGIIGGLGVASGMAIFVAVSPPTGGVSVPGLVAWAPALAGIAALTVLSSSAGLRSRGTARVIWLAAATAVIYALVNALTKSSVGLLMHQGAGVLATWEPYTLMAAGILSGLFGQSVFNAGPLSLSLPVIDTVEPVSSVILGAAVFGERLARSPGLLALQLIGGVIAATGIAVLSRSPVTRAEECRESRAVGAPPDRPPAREGNRA